MSNLVNPNSNGAGGLFSANDSSSVETLLKRARSNASTNEKTVANSDFTRALAAAPRDERSENEVRDSRKMRDARDTRDTRDSERSSRNDSASDRDTKSSDAVKRFEERKAQKAAAKKEKENSSSKSEGNSETKSASSENSASSDSKSADKNTSENSKAAASNAGKETLQQEGEKVIKGTTVERLAKVLGRGNMAAARSEAIALVSGQLENLNPKEIPAIVSENPFVSNAMSNPTEDFLKTEVSIKDLMNQLDLDEDVIQTAEKFGVNLGEMVRPTEFFKVIGIDPHKVSAQIMRLKSEMPKNGLSHFMTEAGSALKTDPMLEQKNRDQLLGEAAGFGLKTEAKDQIMASSGMQSAKTMSVPSQRPGVISGPQYGLTETSYGDLSEEEKAAADSIISSFTNDKVKDSEALSSVAKSNEEALQSTDGSQPLKINAEKTSIDPFEKLGLTLKHKKVITPSENATFVDAYDTGDELARLKHSAPGFGEGNFKLKSSADEKALELENLKFGESLKGATSVNETLTKDAVKAPTDVFELDRFAGELAADFSEEETKLKEDDKPSDFRFERSLENASKVRTSISETADSQAVTSTQSTSKPSADRVKFAEDVMDKARILLTKGGGSMAFQMKMGQNEVLDIAIKLSGDQLNLRLGSESSTVRDQLAAEIGSLEASLKSQNIQLTGVEVGANADGDGEQNQQQNFSGFNGQSFEERSQNQSLINETFENSLSGTRGRIENLAEETETTLRKTIARSNPKGRISVAV